MTCAGLASPAKRIVEKVGKLCDSTTVTCAPESRSASRSASREMRRASGTSLGGVLALIMIPLPARENAPRGFSVSALSSASASAPLDHCNLVERREQRRRVVAVTLDARPATAGDGLHDAHGCDPRVPALDQLTQVAHDVGGRVLAVRVQLEDLDYLLAETPLLRHVRGV